MLVLAGVAYGMVRTMGHRPEKQEVDRSPQWEELAGSVDKIAASLRGAIQVRDQVRAGQVGAAQAQTELQGISNDLAAMATGLEQTSAEPRLLLSYQRVSRFASNAARQVSALASNAPPDSLDRTEARLHAMLTATGRLRVSITPRTGIPG